ncbi:unnamed protein product [Strongylus vulgaris]|uniref:Uncharacterized protein n=1 Tax=Strongylus vulgaris TaxID=40348 RepID=A0A3P7IXA1_STRVU|nr:unnamed protein product [Strongylus vulgaris]
MVAQPNSDIAIADQPAKETPLGTPRIEAASVEKTNFVKAVENPLAEKNHDASHVEKSAEKSEVEKPAGKVSYENPLIDFHTSSEEERNKSPSTITAEPVHKENITNHVRTNGIEHQAHPEIAADLPGTVPSKEGDGSLLRKVPTPPNDFLISTQAHRLRREQEQREIDERKARIAAILAKSRDLSSGAPVVGGRISPPRGLSVNRG